MVIAIIVGIVGSSRLVESWQERTVQFDLGDDVGGLNVGDDVRIGGFKVGVIKDIQLFGYENPEPKAQPKVLVTFSLPSRYVIRDGTRVRIQGTLTGQSWLNIDYLGAGEAIGNASPIEGNASMMTVLESTLSDIAPQAKGLVADVRTGTVPRVNNALDHATALVSDLQTQEGSLAPKAQALLDRAIEALTAVRDIIGPSTGDFRGAVADVHHITSSVNDRLPSLLDEASSIFKTLDVDVQKAETMLTDAQATLANTRDATGTLRSVIVDNRGKLDAMIGNFKTTSDNLKEASATIQRSPWRLLYKPGPDEVANLNLFDSAREFADGANSVSDASAALRDALKDKDADPAEIKKLQQVLDDSFAHFQQVEQKLWKSVQQ
jgi:ABC-type transporter Mla subunit MlaD